MTWDYRIIRYANGRVGLHEVYYATDRQPSSRTQEPATFCCDDDEGPIGIVRSLEMALKDARLKPVLDDFVEEEAKAAS